MSEHFYEVTAGMVRDAIAREVPDAAFDANEDGRRAESLHDFTVQSEGPGHLVSVQANERVADAVGNAVVRLLKDVGRAPDTYGICEGGEFDFVIDGTDYLEKQYREALPWYRRFGK